MLNTLSAFAICLRKTECETSFFSTTIYEPGMPFLSSATAAEAMSSGAAVAREPSDVRQGSRRANLKFILARMVLECEDL